MTHAEFILRWNGCDYQHTTKRGWYKDGKFIGKNATQANKRLRKRGE